MSERKFSIVEAVGFGWGVMKNNIGLFVGLLLLMAAINFVRALIAHVFQMGAAISADSPALSTGFRAGMLLLSVLVRIGGAVLQLIVGMGFTRITLKFCDGEEAGFSDLFSCVNLFFKFLGSSVLYGLAVIAATGIPVGVWLVAAKAAGVRLPIIVAAAGLLVIPGIYLAIRLGFCYYCVVDRELGPVLSLKKSFEITQDSAWHLFLFGLLVCLINLAGAMCLLIGLFATLPTAYVATAYVYRKLLAASESAPPGLATSFVNC